MERNSFVNSWDFCLFDFVEPSALEISCGEGIGHIARAF